MSFYNHVFCLVRLCIHPYFPPFISICNLCLAMVKVIKKKCEAYYVRLWNPTQRIFCSFSLLRIFLSYFSHSDFTVEIIFYSATWSLNVTCFTLRYFKPRKESHHCIPRPLSFPFLLLLLLLHHWQEGKGFLQTFFILKYILSDHRTVNMILLISVAILLFLQSSDFLNNLGKVLIGVNKEI